MATKIEKFQKVYLHGHPDRASDKQMNELLMVSENWDYYFTSLLDKKNADAEELIDVHFVEFDSKEDCKAFVNLTEPSRLIDISFQHDRPCLLMSAQ